MKFFIVFLCISNLIFSQNKINEYKYIIVDKQFDFVKEPDKFQTSSITKFLFNKEGFIPQDLLANRCLALKATVKDASNMFKTKSKIQLLDCFNKVVFTSNEGVSKIKDYKKAYHEAIRSAFVSIKSLNYNYKPIKGKSQKKKSVEDTSENLKKDTGGNTSNNKMLVKKGTKKEDNPFSTTKTPVLYADSFDNGFKLFNAKKTLTFTILKTKLNNVFIIDNKNGVLYKENNIWKAEYYNSDGSKVFKEYDVRMGN